ncbi:Uncharacterized protein GBIM_12505 [Gryllus bimaculatus]|nr:Uncharacterized protein GBIM_12505 [Gryllus bimaculatus]
MKNERRRCRPLGKYGGGGGEETRRAVPSPQTDGAASSAGRTAECITRAGFAPSIHQPTGAHRALRPPRHGARRDDSFTSVNEAFLQLLRPCDVWRVAGAERGVVVSAGKWCPRRDWQSPADARAASEARRGVLYSSVFLGSPGEYNGITRVAFCESAVINHADRAAARAACARAGPLRRSAAVAHLPSPPADGAVREGDGLSAAMCVS